jgi:hypothetical protein
MGNFPSISEATRLAETPQKVFTPARQDLRSGSAKFAQAVQSRSAGLLSYAGAEAVKTERARNLGRSENVLRKAEAESIAFNANARAPHTMARRADASRVRAYGAAAIAAFECALCCAFEFTAVTT